MVSWYKSFLPTWNALLHSACLISLHCQNPSSSPTNCTKPSSTISTNGASFLFWFQSVHIPISTYHVLLHNAHFLPFFFLAPPTAYRRSQARDWTWATGAIAMTTPSPQLLGHPIFFLNLCDGIIFWNIIWYYSHCWWFLFLFSLWGWGIYWIRGCRIRQTIPKTPLTSDTCCCFRGFPRPFSGLLLR